MQKTLMELLKEKGLKDNQISTHESDLYCKVCPESTEAIKEYSSMLGVNLNETTFIDNINKELWYDIPFGYMPEHFNKTCK